MKVIYNAILAQLKATVPAIKWIDQEMGQLDIKPGERPAVKFPCAIIGIEYNQCNDLDNSGKIQECKSNIIVRIAFDTPTQRTSSAASETIREKDLSPQDTINDIYKSLQGFGTDDFDPISRVSQRKEIRSDGLFVERIIFKCEFEDRSALS